MRADAAALETKGVLFMETRNRREFLASLGVGAASLAVPGLAASAGPKGKRPNIVFIMVDDMGYADLGCYGSKVIETPRLDRMAAEGMRFTQAYSGCTVCAPARSTLMTGTHMGHTPVRGNTGGVPLPDGDVTVAEVLEQAGYATGGFGKWGLGDLDTCGVPEKQGFDVFFGYYHQIHAHYYYPDYLVRNGDKVPLPGNQGGKHGQYSHYLIFDETLRFIRDHRDEPFFCYVPWTPPHGRYEIPESDPAWRMYKDKQWPDKAKVAAAMDTMIDRHVGRLLDLLDELGIEENTIVFFCSDNGAAFRSEDTLASSGPFRGCKRSMYEGGIRTPLIVRWPEKIEAGSTSDLPCYFPDMLPTLAELADAESRVPGNIDGVSIVPTLLGQGTQKTHEYMYWEWARYDWRKKKYEANGLMQAVRHGDWKIVRHKQDQPWELYDLSKDLGETNDIAAENPELVKRLDAWIEENRVEPEPQIEPEKPKGKSYR